MNDDIERLNDRNRELNEEVSPGDQSQARHSSITTPDEDNKRSIAEGIIQELGNHTQEIDSIKEAIKIIGDQINAQTQAINQLAQGGIQPGTPTQPGQGLNMETISMIGDLFEKGAAAYKSLKGNDGPLVDEFTKQITDNAKNEAIESLNIVHLINKKVKGKLVQDIAGDIAGNVINDSTKQNSHAPE